MALTVMALVLAAAVWFDLRERRIPNRLLFPALGLGLLAGFVAGGIGVLADRALGAAVGLLILLPFFALRVVGAGDAKLMAVVGAFVGPAPLLPIALYTFIAGGLLALVGFVLARSAGPALSNLRTVLFAAGLRAQGAPIDLGSLGLKTALRLPYALAIAAGVAAWALAEAGLP